MKRLTWGILCMAAIGLAACMTGRENPSPQPPTEPAVTTRINAPPMPTVIDLRTGAWSARFYPTDIRSGYTVIVTSPSTPELFTAYGFDVSRGTTVFAVTGPAGQRERFTAQVERETAALPRNLKDTLALGMALGTDPLSGGFDTGALDGGTSVGQPKEDDPPKDTPNINQEYEHHFAWTIAVLRHQAPQGTVVLKAAQMKFKAAAQH